MVNANDSVDANRLKGPRIEYEVEIAGDYMLADRRVRTQLHKCANGSQSITVIVQAQDARAKVREEDRIAPMAARNVQDGSS